MAWNRPNSRGNSIESHACRSLARVPRLSSYRQVSTGSIVPKTPQFIPGLHQDKPSNGRKFRKKVYKQFHRY